MRNVKNAIKVAIFLGFATAAFTMPAAADYNFSVKVKNNTNNMLTNVTAYWKAKGSNKQKTCWSDSKAIQKKKSIQHRCGSTANSKKWQRRIQVNFDCPNGTGVKYFPAANKYFARDHAVNNKNKYTVTIKTSDC